MAAKQAPRAKGKSEERFKKIFVYLIGFAFVVVGLNGTIRTYCSTLSGVHYPDLVHACILYTAPGLFLANIVTMVIGIVIIFLDGILNWLLGVNR